MFKSMAAVERGGALVFRFGFKAVAPRGNITLDEFKEFRSEAFAAKIRSRHGMELAIFLRICVPI